MTLTVDQRDLIQLFEDEIWQGGPPFADLDQLLAEGCDIAARQMIDTINGMNMVVLPVGPNGTRLRVIQVRFSNDAEQTRAIEAARRVLHEQQAIGYVHLAEIWYADGISPIRPSARADRKEAVAIRAVDATGVKCCTLAIRRDPEDDPAGVICGLDPMGEPTTAIPGSLWDGLLREETTEQLIEAHNQRHNQRLFELPDRRAPAPTDDPPNADQEPRGWHDEARERLMHRIIDVLQETMNETGTTVLEPWDFLLPFVPIVTSALQMGGNDPVPLALRFCAQVLVGLKGSAATDIVIEALITSVVTLLGEVINEDVPEAERDDRRRDVARRLARHWGDQ